ncbi:WXG100 family type VII secretion target [Glycomyces tarimensis]
MAGFDVDPETIRKSADELDGAKDEVQALLDQFTASVEQYADAFGGDTIGTAGGIAHGACVGAVTECFTGIVEDLTGLSEALRAMADDHQATDDEIAQVFSALQGELEA